MAQKQKRQVLLKKGRRAVTLKLGSGHVWEMDNGTVGYPLYDPKKEIALFTRLLRAWQKKGFRVVEDTGVVKEAGPKKPPTMSASTWRWVQSADQILTMWTEDDYDNYKDAIQDADSMLAKAPADQGARAKKLAAMLAKVTRELAQLAKKDPSVREEARELLEPLKKVKKRAATKSARKTAKKTAKA